MIPQVENSFYSIMMPVLSEIILPQIKSSFPDVLGRTWTDARGRENE
jgi:hypothetical protein